MMLAGSERDTESKCTLFMHVYAKKNYINVHTGIHGIV